jgi:hypothetical protein
MIITCGKCGMTGESIGHVCWPPPLTNRCLTGFEQELLSEKKSGRTLMREMADGLKGASILLEMLNRPKDKSVLDDILTRYEEMEKGGRE